MYTELLIETGHLKEKYPEEFFLKLSSEGIPQYQELVQDWLIGISGLKTTCEQRGFSSFEKAFVFNDLDNLVWSEKGSLVLTNQNIGFYFKIQDENSFTVYLLDGDKDPSKIDTKIEKSSIKTLRDIVLKVESKKISWLNYSLMESLALDLEFSVKAMNQEGLLQIEYPVDIYSYGYQKNYYAAKYGFSEFEFLAQAFLTLGGGFSYDKKKKRMVDSRVKYIPNLPEAKNSRDRVYTQTPYMYIDTINSLDSEWLEGLKYMVEVLKRDRPIPTVFKEPTAQEALDCTIKSLEGTIKKLEKNAMAV